MNHADTDEQLLRDCRVETYRASGPGGQKRNKTSSAVRITHLPSGICATATESRSQLENRARALHRLRLELALSIRGHTPQPPDWWRDITNANARLSIGPRSHRFAHAVGVIFDILDQANGSVADAAALLGTSTAALVAMLAAHPRVWAAAQELRRRHGHHALANPRK